MKPLRFMVVALLAASCASAGPLPLPDQRASRSAPLCFFNNAVWTSGTALRAPYGNGPVFRVAYRQKRPWPKVNGVVRGDGGAVLFEAVLRGDGITARGEIDVSREPLLYAHRRLELEGLGTLEPFAQVQVVGGTNDHILVGPSAWALEEIRPVKPAVATVRCEDVTLTMKVFPFNEAERRLEALGFPKDSPVRYVPEHKAAPLHASANGPLVAELVARDYRHVLRLLGTEGEWSKVALVNWTGATFIGWTKTEGLTAPEAEGADGLLGGLGIGSVGKRAEPPRLQACAVKQALGARVNGKLERLGELDPGVPFEVRGEPRDGVVAVRLHEAWLVPEKDVELVLPEVAMICPAAAPTNPAPMR